MARSGRNMTVREKKQLTDLTKGRIDPSLYVVIREINSDKEQRTLHIRHKETTEEFTVTLPR